MASRNGSTNMHELYFFQDSDSGSGVTTTRVFFKEDLDPFIFRGFIRPTIIDLLSRPDSIGSIDGYPHSIAVRWLHVDIVTGLTTLQERGDEVKQTLDIVVTDAFDMDASVRKTLANSAEVRKIAAKLKLDWSRGQMPF